MAAKKKATKKTSKEAAKKAAKKTSKKATKTATKTAVTSAPIKDTKKATSAPAKKARKTTRKAATKKAAKAPEKTPAKKAAAKAPKKAAAGRPTNPAILARTLLEPMVDSSYYPQKPVADGQALLLELAAKIERERPMGEAVYVLTHATTEAFNDLQEAFYEAGSEIETVAREAIAADIDFVLKTYGYDVDLEEAIAPRDW